jgi:DNA mismatch repair protein MutS
VRGGGEADGGNDPDGGTRQVVFDLSSGSFSDGGDADSAAGDGATSDPETDRNGTSPESTQQDDGGAAEADAPGESHPAARAVVEELRDVDVASTAPVELLARVQEWQERLDERG